MAAADALAEQGESAVSALLEALTYSDEGVRLHAALSLTKAFGNRYASQIADARDASADPYVVKRLTELLESSQLGDKP
ncbi:MAG: hypothetical protein ACOX5G_14025 [Kiritimatiellia bacterium]